MFDELPPNAIIGVRTDGFIYSNADRNFDECSIHQLAAYFIPAHGTDSMSVIGTRDNWLSYARRFIPRTSGVHFTVTDAGAAASPWAPAGGSYELSDSVLTDSGALHSFAIHEMPLEVLSNPGLYGPIFQHHMKMGWFEQKASRPRPPENVGAW